MKINPISKTKTSQISIKEVYAKNLKKYADHLSKENNTEFEISDIISALLLDEKNLQKLPKNNEQKLEKVSLKLPEIAWNNLEKYSKKTGLNKEKLIEILSEKIIKSREFSKLIKK